MKKLQILMVLLVCGAAMQAQAQNGTDHKGKRIVSATKQKSAVSSMTANAGGGNSGTRGGYTEGGGVSGGITENDGTRGGITEGGAGSGGNGFDGSYIAWLDRKDGGRLIEGVLYYE